MVLLLLVVVVTLVTTVLGTETVCGLPMAAADGGPVEPTDVGTTRLLLRPERRGDDSCCCWLPVAAGLALVAVVDTVTGMVRQVELVVEALLDSTAEAVIVVGGVDVEMDGTDARDADIVA